MRAPVSVALILSTQLLFSCDSVIQAETGADVTATCAEAELISYDFTVEINSTEGCDWGEDGNLAATEDTFAARSEHFEQAPVGAALLCTMDFDFDGNWSFADEFFLLWNGGVVASSNEDAVDELDDSGYLPQWEWDDVAGIPRERNTADYCLGAAEGSECDIPSGGGGWGGGGGGGQGPLEVELEPSVQAVLASNAWTVGRLDIGIVATGDDGNRDCSHANLEMTISGTALVSEDE